MNNSNDDDFLTNGVTLTSTSSSYNSDTITITLPSDTYSYSSSYTSSSPYIITSNMGSMAGSNGIWSTTGTVSNNTTFSSSNQKAVMTIPYGEEKMILEEGAALDVKGKLIVNGQDLEERLSTIEKVLQIPQRDVIMESKYAKLKKLYEEYMRELEKLRTWDALKESK